MSAIFISHSSKDNAIAGDIKAKLEQQGYRSVFLDFDPEEGIPAGRSWEKELYANLRRCQAVIVLCSEHSIASPWCFAEITQARSLGKHIFPLKIASCQISPLLSDVQVTDLTLNLSEGYQRLWFGLKKVGLDPADLFDWDETRPAYPGLLAFQEQDAAVYFGRNAAIQETMETLSRLQRLGGSRLVLVLGASGSGKSSLVRAGVIPRLKRDKDRWLVLEPFRPRRRPFDELAMVLAGALTAFGDARDWRSVRDALNLAADHVGGADLLDMANDLRVAASRREATVLLVVDQFEELLGRDTDPSAQLFFRLLKAVLSEPRSAFLAVAILRSDFLGAFQMHEAVQGLLYELLPLPQMGLADFAQVIEGPAGIAGVELEAGLAQAMVADTATDDALPLLAFTLRELWDRYSGDGRLTLEEYRDRLGGLQGSLARAAETIFSERTLSADEEFHLRKTFLSMVRVDEEGRYIRKPAGWTELPEDMHDLLERFVQARLLVSRSEGGDRILEVAHEAFFRSWDRLVAWLNTDREFLLWRRRLAEAQEEWLRTGRDGGALLSGLRLAEVEKWRDRYGDLSAEELEYLRCSARRRSLRFGMMASAFVLALVVLGIAGWLYVKGLTIRHGVAMAQAAVGLFRIEEPKMVEIPVGKFSMGSGKDDPEANPDEHPQHEVVITRWFKMAMYEVTFNEYDRFALATGLPLPDDLRWGRARRPVINVSWQDASAYAKWLSERTGKHYRLPTEAEWEYAARAGTTSRRYWGDDPKHDQVCRYANVRDQSAFRKDGVEGNPCDDGYPETSEVGRLKENGFGLYDMLGNVGEWVQDCAHNSYDGAPTDGTAWDNRAGLDCHRRALRGGSWDSAPNDVRSARRGRRNPNFRIEFLGFRLVEDIP